MRANEQADERMAQYLTHPLHTFSTQSTFVGPSIRRTKFFRIFENAGFQPHRWIGTEHKYIMQQDHDTLCVCVCACARVRICVLGVAKTHLGWPIGMQMEDLSLNNDITTIYQFQLDLSDFTRARTHRILRSKVWLTRDIYVKWQFQRHPSL